MRKRTTKTRLVSPFSKVYIATTLSVASAPKKKTRTTEPVPIVGKDEEKDEGKDEGEDEVEDEEEELYDDEEGEAEDGYDDDDADEDADETAKTSAPAAAHLKGAVVVPKEADLAEVEEDDE